jgi:hypothetical protein
MYTEIMGGYEGGSVTHRAVTQGGQASVEEPVVACPKSSKAQYKIWCFRLGWHGG